MKRRYLITRRVLTDVLGHFNDSDGWALASHVALSAILAIFPFMIFASTLATFLGADRFADVIIPLVFETWPSRAAEPIANEIRNILTVERRGLLTVSFIAAAFFASNGIEALRVALNRAYRVVETRNIIVLRLQSLLFVMIGTVGVLALSFLVVLAPLAYRIAETYVPGIDSFSISIGFLRYSVAILVLVFALYIVHKWLPDGKRKLFSLTPGILITVVFWIAGATIFGYYLESFATYVTTYAGLASIMIALVFLYIIAAIFILGAEVNAALLRYKNARAQIVKPPAKK